MQKSFCFLWLCVPAAAVWMSCGSSSAQPQTTTEDQALVDLFFKDKITAVRRSRDTADDVELIGEILEQAQSVPDSPGVQWLMFQTAIDLATTSEVYPSAIDAAMQMRSAFPEAEAASDDALLELMEEAYRNARRTDRPEIAEPYMDLLDSAGQAAEAGGDIDLASELYRTGATVARAVRSDAEARFTEHVRRVNAIEQLNSRIQALTNAVETNPRNVTAARELVMLLVVDRQDCASAAEFVESTQDEDLIELVGMAAKGLEGVQPSEAMRVADWYFAMAGQDEADALYLLGESAAFYDRFIEIYSRDDALRSRASTMRVLVQSQLDDLADAQAQARLGEWIDCIALIDIEEHSLDDPPTLRRGQLLIDGSEFVIPVRPEGDYDFRMRLQFHRGPEGVQFYLPLGGGEACTVRFSRHEHTASSIAGTGNNKEERFLLSPGDEAEVRVEVREQASGQVELTFLVNDEICSQWSGEPDDLVNPSSTVPPEGYRDAILMRFGGEYVVQSIEVRAVNR